MISRCACAIALAWALWSPAASAQDLFGDPLPRNAVQRLGTTRLRYAGVADVRYLPDGRGMIAAGARIDIWDLAAGRLQTSQVVSRSGIVSAVPRRDGRVVLLADAHGSIREWDLEQGRELRSWETGQQGLRVACYAPDGSRVLSCGAAPPTLKEWELESGRELVSIRGRMHDFSEAMYGPDGRSAVVGGSAGSESVLAHYDLRDGTLIQEWFKDYCIYARCLALSSDGSRFLAGSRHQATEWQLDSYKMLRSFRGHLGHAVVSVAYCRDPNQLLTGSRDGSIRRWDRLAGQVLAHWRPHSEFVTRLQVSPDGKWVLSYGGGMVAETSVEDGSPRLHWERHMQAVRCVAALPRGRAVSGSDDGSLRVWDLASGRSLTTLRDESLIPRAVAVSPDGRLVAAACKDGAVREFPLAGGQPVRELQAHTGFARSVIYGREGLISSGDDGAIRFWRSAGTEPARTIAGDLSGQSGHRGGVLCLALSPDAELLLSGGRDGTMRVWRMRDGLPAATFRDHRGWVEAVAFAGSERRAVSASRDGCLRLWDLASGKLVREIPTGGAITALACEPSGTRAWIGNRGGAINCWDLATGQQASALPGHTGSITALAHNGQYLISASEDTTLLVWR